MDTTASPLNALSADHGLLRFAKFTIPLYSQPFDCDTATQNGDVNFTQGVRTHPAMASVDVRVGSCSGYLGHDSGLIHGSLLAKRWLRERDDAPILHSAKSSEDIIQNHQDRIQETIDRVFGPLEGLPGVATSSFRKQTGRQLLYQPKKVEQKAPVSHNVLGLEPSTAASDINPRAIDRTARLSVSILQVLGDKPDYAKSVIEAINNLPEEQQNILRYGCPCVERQGQCASDKVYDASRYDDGCSLSEKHCDYSNGSVSYNESEDKSNDSDDEGSSASYYTELVDGDSSRSNTTPRSGQTGTTSSSSRSSKRTSSGKAPNKRMNGKGGGDGDDDDGHGGRKKRKKASVGKGSATSKHWLCPYYFICSNLPKSCLPLTTFDEFTDLITHLRKPDAGGHQRDAQSFMSEETLKSVKDVVESLRGRCERNTADWHKKSLQLFRGIWGIIRPDTKFPFVSPFCEDLRTCSHQKRAIVASIYKTRAEIARQSQPGSFTPDEEENIDIVMETIGIVQRLDEWARRGKQTDTSEYSPSVASDHAEPSGLHRDSTPPTALNQHTFAAADDTTNPAVNHNMAVPWPQTVATGLPPPQFEQPSHIPTLHRPAAFHGGLQPSVRQEPSTSALQPFWPAAATTTGPLFTPNLGDLHPGNGVGNYYAPPRSSPTGSFTTLGTLPTPNSAQSFAPGVLGNSIPALGWSGLAGSAAVGTQQRFNPEAWAFWDVMKDEPDLDAFLLSSLNPPWGGN
ncbi:hypothetical protein CSOJ01_03397 [Colletotrichum sojae]|uniref:Uncharacterized protein n=1 Tax=Colletotrichum sojae TaxID=2175907 RepID=A0A8H6N0E1_9PEZI|nr:hypothetical protein CSOJ01_03397 [Colletotrichum sojae]